MRQRQVVVFNACPFHLYNWIQGFKPYLEEYMVGLPRRKAQGWSFKKR
jgi:hypothetical protein